MSVCEEVLSRLNVGIQDDVRQKNGVVAKDDMISDDGVGTDVGVGPDTSGGCDGGSGMNAGGVGRGVVEELDGSGEG
jgi:hypothetical protein